MPRTFAFVALALLGFAANSLLCRAALVDTAITPAVFTAWRIAAGAATLALIVLLRAAPQTFSGRSKALRARPEALPAAPPALRDEPRALSAAPQALRGQPRALRSAPQSLRGGDWRGALALFVYAIAFAQAYVALDAGLGALLLFGAVQLTMLVAARVRGERFGARQWSGFALAVLGLLAMKLPPGLLPGAAGDASPVPWQAITAMLLAGIAWGVYSLLGRGSADPLRDTAGNFLRATPLALLFAWFEPDALIVEASLPLPWDGIAYAVASGALASGIGYALWYAALPRLLASQAALLQLLVPVIAAIGGIALLGEHLDARVLIGGSAILAGVALALAKRTPR